MADFLLPMLELDPAKRAIAGGMSNHPFMNNTPGMKDNLVDIQCGTRGGIEGWASEVKEPVRRR